MADPRFFQRAGPFLLHQLATCGEAKLASPADSARQVADVQAIETAGPEDITFAEDKRYGAALAACRAGAILLPAELAAAAPPGAALLLTEAPSLAFARIARLFYPETAPEPGIHRSAEVAADAKLGNGVSVAPGAIIGSGAEIGQGTRIGAYAVIAPGVVIGRDGRIGDHCSISHAIIGDRAILAAGTRIGQPGFGLVAGPEGLLRRPQLGRVIVGDDVEIGANCAIDRGAAGDTVISDGCKIDNLVHIGHNVRLGRGCIIAGQVGVAGSCVLEDYVQLGGQVGLSDHVTIGRGARVMAQSGLLRDVEPGSTVGGTPAVPIRQHHRQVAILARLARRKGD
jgi:UDP-3-O-[3-hydroxymyristoyl] glucosamine N-acyltransferase